MAELSLGRIFRRGFGGIFHARGRDDRMQFWIFSAMVFGPLIVAMMIVQTVMIFSGIAMPTLAEAADPQATQLRMMTDMQHSMIAIAHVSSAIMAFGALLLTTAAARRLHDRGRSGWWALALPCAAVASGFDQARRAEWVFGRMEALIPEMQRQAADPDFIVTFQAKLQEGMPGPDWTAIVAGIAMLWLAVELVRAGTDGPNRFGGAPE